MPSFKIFCIILLLPIFSLGLLKKHFTEKDLLGGDHDTSESENIQVVRPLTFGAAVQTEIARLQSLQDVYPPQGLSYFQPYGDRTIVSFQYPSVSDEQLAQVNQQSYGYGPNIPVDQYGPPKDHYGPPKDHYGPPKDHYGPPKDQYGPPREKYGPPPQKPKKSEDLGIIVSQNYIYRENIRDFANFSKSNQHRPSNELIIELAKAFTQQNGQSFSVPLNPQSSGGYGRGPAQNSPSFVIVSIESRQRNSEDSRKFGFVAAGNSLTNGTIIFPSPNNPSLLTNIPFVLRDSEDVHTIFDGDEQATAALIPNDKREIKNFLRLVSGINEDIHQEGILKIEQLRQRSNKLKRPRLPDTTELEADSLANEEARARKTSWLYTSTVGLRTLTPSSSSSSSSYENKHTSKLVAPLTDLTAPISNSHGASDHQHGSSGFSSSSYNTIFLSSSK